ncbi:hypothetical protein N3K66_002524 [Trichothecium roseum]|uniref:Uncharacterized protein n=1 Tax=Trichothecium roseum TaxID=47278 RepID=A0ACC0VBA3_9HYPO|nr:hypothetical protein N3K66_002524 [Trichothecium roseum]
MPPKAGSGGAPRGRPKGGGGKAQAAKPKPAASEQVDQDLLDPFASSSATEGEDDEVAAAAAGGSGQQQQQSRGAAGEEPREAEKAVPRELLTRILHEFFAKDATRMSRDANAAVGKYVDVFVREAIARTAVEKKGGFLEVEDLEKISPQLLLDL